MSFLDSIGNFFYPVDDQVAKGNELDSQLRAKNEVDYAPGGDTYGRILDKQGIDAANAAQQKVLNDLDTGATDALIKTGDANYDASHGPKDSGVGALLKDTFLLAIIGAAVWAFIKFGGLAWLKGLSRKASWAPWAILAVVAALAWFAYSKLKQTATDAKTVSTNVGDSVNALLN